MAENLDKKIRSKIHKKIAKSINVKEAEGVKRPKKPNGGGSIRQRPNGKWEGRIMINKKTHTVTADSREEAQEKLNLISNPFEFLSKIKPETVTVADWVKVWFEVYGADVKASTIKRYDIDTRLRIVPYLGNYRVIDLKPVDIKKLYSIAQKNGLSTKSIKNLHGTLHTILNTAVENEIIIKNPASNVKIPRSDKPQKEMRPFKDTEVATFISLINGHELEGLFFIALFTGMREAELIGLTWDCVDFEKKTIKVYQQLPKDLNHYDEIHFTSLKNGKSRIIVPPDEVFTVLHKVSLQQKMAQLKAGEDWKNNNDFVFTTQNGRHLSYQTIYRKFKAIASKMGLPEVRFHDLRHTYATLAIQNGADIKTVSSNLGHSTVAFTLQVYGHVSDTMRRDCADKLNAFIASM